MNFFKEINHMTIPSDKVITTVASVIATVVEQFVVFIPITQLNDFVQVVQIAVPGVPVTEVIEIIGKTGS